jgi:hypothetical protein
LEEAFHRTLTDFVTETAPLQAGERLTSSGAIKVVE